jgi:hypothetical protein
MTMRASIVNQPSRGLRGWRRKNDSPEVKKSIHGRLVNCMVAIGRVSALLRGFSLFFDLSFSLRPPVLRQPDVNFGLCEPFQRAVGSVGRFSVDR